MGGPKGSAPSLAEDLDRGLAPHKDGAQPQLDQSGAALLAVVKVTANGQRGSGSGAAARGWRRQVGQARMEEVGAAGGLGAAAQRSRGPCARWTPAPAPGREHLFQRPSPGWRRGWEGAGNQWDQ